MPSSFTIYASDRDSSFGWLSKNAMFIANKNLNEYQGFRNFVLGILAYILVKMDDKKQRQLKAGAKISLIVLLLSIVGQFISIYQTSYQLVSPFIPQGAIWEISKQFIFRAFVLTVSCIMGLVLYFYNKYLWVIMLVVLTIIASRFVYLPASWLFLPSRVWV